jgi:hypothetical protein
MINIQFLYTDRFGNFFPLLQNFNRIASVRLMFQAIEPKVGMKRSLEPK